MPWVGPPYSPISARIDSAAKRRCELEKGNNPLPSVSTDLQICLLGDGPCRDFNYDPTILPTGIAVSDDPLLAARSAAYAKSFDLRTAEAADYPYTPRPAADR